jgi:hypothetical protein
MANELEITGTMKYSKGGVKSELALSSRVNISGSKVTELVQNIGTGSEAIELGDLSSPGYIIIENLDSTNFVTIQAAVDGTSMITIPAGEFAGPVKLASSAPAARADSAAVNIRILAIQA